MDVSIIIVNYRTADLVIDCINSVFEKTNSVTYEVIVVDNASGDDSVYKLQSVFGETIKVIPSPDNLGFGKGNNLGAEFASGKYLFLLNPDTYLLNNAIKVLSDYLDANPKVGATGGNLFFPDESPAPSFCREFDIPQREATQARWNKILGNRLKTKLGSREKRSFFDEFNYSADSFRVAYVFGADMMIRHDLFRELKGFDPVFFMYAEEEELSWRINKAGYEIVSVPEARIVHLEGAATQADGRFNERQFRMRMNGKLIYYRKCFGPEGMETFYSARKRLYKRLMTLAKLRGRDPNASQASIMLHCLEDEYQKFKERLLSSEF